MRSVSTGSNNPAPQNFRDNLGWLAGTVHAVVGKLIGRETQGVQRAKAGFVTEKRTPGHGHASRQHNFDGRIQPQNRNAGSTQKIGAAWLRVSAVAKGESRAFFQLRSAARSEERRVGKEGRS